MKKLLLTFVLFISIASLQAQVTVNDPNAEKREAKGFNAISVSNAFDVYISQGDEEAVVVSASEEKYKQNIKVEVKGGVLKIWFEKEGKFWRGWNGDKLKLKAYISFKEITKLIAAGACDVHVQGSINAKDLDINLSGASDLKDGKVIVANNLTVDVSGASDVNVSGSATNLKVEASGASDFKGYGFAVDYCNVRASGASSISITVNKELSAHASGASDVHYKGNGLIKEIKTSGASSISKRS
jgi:Putative auto-transporter adhesin, head GIN domain